jgi:hypothetical protein
MFVRCAQRGAPEAWASERLREAARVDEGTVRARKNG